MDEKIVRRALINNFLEIMDAIPANQGLDTLLTLLFMVAWILDSEEEMRLIGLMSHVWPEIHEAVRERLSETHPHLFN